jgi:hypothetical protein
MAEDSAEFVAPISKAEIAQSQVQSNFRALERLFSSTNPKGVPSVGILDAGKVDFFPQIDAADSAKVLPIVPYLTNFGAGTYHAETNTILVKLDRADPHFLAHETTHSVVKVQDHEVKLNADALAAFEGFYPGFGPLVQDLAVETRIIEFNIDMNEFFAPLGEAYLLGDNSQANLERWKQQYEKVLAMTKPEDAQKRAGFTKALLEHLPELAAELLIKNRSGDVKGILHDNPNIAHMKGQEIWDKYCTPILTTGQLPGSNS